MLVYPENVHNMRYLYNDVTSRKGGA